jgi:2-dehydro-3-deoxygluconokinase
MTIGSRVVTFGEVMLRLKSPGFERLIQSAVLEASFGGAEANVAVSLAQFGVPVSFASAIPANPLGDACLGELQRFGVDTSRVRRQGSRLGVYFLEAGANQRPSKVVYDRSGSAIATAKPGDFDWDVVLDGVTWFHVTGVTPAISQSAADLAIDGARRAREKGITVSCDYNYRKNLWKYGTSARDVMRELVRHVNVGIANEVPVRRGASARGVPESRPSGDHAAREPQCGPKWLVGRAPQPERLSGEPTIRDHRYRRPRWGRGLVRRRSDLRAVGVW